MKMWLIVGALGLVSCTKPYQVMNLRLQCPELPPLPIIQSEELAPITDETYYKLMERELRLKEHIDLLESFCD